MDTKPIPVPELKDTLTQMLSDDYRERFKAEYLQTMIRAQKLDNMIVKYLNGELDFEPATPIKILRTQLDVMIEYLSWLEVRAQIEGIDLSSGVPEPVIEPEIVEEQ